MKAVLTEKVRSTDKIGDEVPKKDAARFVRAGLAKYEADDDITALRAEYRAKVGKQPGSKWDEARIRDEMAKATETADD